jgi:hypothetical protein
VTFYFPQIGWLAAQQPAFQAGSERVDLSLATQLTHRMSVPQTAADGTN